MCYGMAINQSNLGIGSQPIDCYNAFKRYNPDKRDYRLSFYRKEIANNYVAFHSRNGGDSLFNRQIA